MRNPASAIPASHRSSYVQMLALLMLIGGVTAFPAVACQRLVLGDQVLDRSGLMPNLDFPDRNYNGVGGFLTNAYDCPPGDTEFVVDVPLAGLTYVRDTVYQGLALSLYQFSDRSPLIAMRYQLSSASGRHSMSLHPGIRATLPVTFGTTETVNAGVVFFFFFRGGAMESVPYRFLGTIEAWPITDPGQRLRSPVSLGFTLAPVTCTIANASHSLDDVLANELAASGSNAKESSFDVAMNCPMDNIDVQLSLADANDPGSSNGQLAPAPGATAGGVQVQLLRGGQPVQFGQAWSHGWSSKGQQAIPFSARYLRTADPLVPGDVKGEAVLTADYR
ncbi:fimbrial protein [Stenotrophomonas maltophilia]|uniref:fimbrial protein n=1 Tax=Stenotrophomonas maltophilia TaxID=40324 RepID=UPI001E523F85|nr:fimbrial protein [Stenotrophomonas maltophilia]